MSADQWVQSKKRPHATILETSYSHLSLEIKNKAREFCKSIGFALREMVQDLETGKEKKQLKADVSLFLANNAVWTPAMLGSINSDTRNILKKSKKRKGEGTSVLIDTRVLSGTDVRETPTLALHQSVAKSFARPLTSTFILESPTPIDVQSIHRPTGYSDVNAMLSMDGYPQTPTSSTLSSSSSSSSSVVSQPPSSNPNLTRPPIMLSSSNISPADELRRAALYRKMNQSVIALSENVKKDRDKLLKIAAREKFIRDSFASLMVNKDDKVQEQRRLTTELRTALEAERKAFIDMKQAIDSKCKEMDDLQKERQLLEVEYDKFRTDRAAFFAEMGVPIDVVNSTSDDL